VEGQPQGVPPQPLARLRSLIGEFYQARYGRQPAPPSAPRRLAEEFRRLRKRLRKRGR
jgi:hypothetical protein